MSTPQAVLQVVILRDGLLVGTEVLTPGSFSIGSGSQVDLRLDDPTVEPIHAVLYFQNGRSAIQDNNSRLGVYVNGHRVSACEIRSVDETVVGPFVLKTRVLSNQPKSEKPAPSPEVAALLRGGGPAPRQSAPTLPPAVPSRSPASPSPSPVRAAPSPTPLRPAPVAAAVPVAPAPVVPMRPPAEGGTVLSARRASTAAVPQIRAVTPPPARESALSAEPVTDNLRILVRPTVPRPSTAGKGRPRVYFELYWGDIRKEVHSFGRIKKKKPVLAAASDTANVPLWGFGLPEEGYVLAESHGKSYRVFIPPSCKVEGAEKIENDEGRRYVTLGNGSGVLFTEGAMSLAAFVAPPEKKVWGNPLAGLPWLALSIFMILSGGFVSALIYGPSPSAQSDFQERKLQPVAVRLLAPEPKKKVPEPPKVEEPPELVEKPVEVPKEEPVEKKEPAKVVKKEKAQPKPSQPPPAESKALKALARLSAAGPATNDVLAAIDKMGSGPGSKNAKNNFKLSAMVGKEPIANAGLGSFGLGGGGQGGRGTKGLEMLNGRGAGGIGALGANGFGKGGKVGGTVGRASVRNIAVQGSIDREEVARTVNAHLQEVRGCYERALLKDPGLAGKVVLEWTISTTGAVTTAKTKTSSLKNGEVEACILRSLKSWQFPKPSGGVVIVSYPFLFNSVGY